MLLFLLGFLVFKLFLDTLHPFDVIDQELLLGEFDQSTIVGVLKSILRLVELISFIQVLLAFLLDLVDLLVKIFTNNGLGIKIFSHFGNLIVELGDFLVDGSEWLRNFLLLRIGSIQNSIDLFFPLDERSRSPDELLSFDQSSFILFGLSLLANSFCHLTDAFLDEVLTVILFIDFLHKVGTFVLQISKTFLSSILGLVDFSLLSFQITNALELHTNFFRVSLPRLSSFLGDMLL